MLADIIEFDKWIAKSISDVAALYSDPTKNSVGVGHEVSWKGFKDSLSPLTLYIYLKARFGAPNGPLMLFRNLSINNLIHWHYVIHSGDALINFWGHSGGLEITISSLAVQIDNNDRTSFVTAINSDFQKHGLKMGTIKKQLDHWNIFINPFQRLNETLHALVTELENIDISMPSPSPDIPTAQETRGYVNETRTWVKNITKAAALGTTLRMLFPVVLESFVNLVLYVFKNKSLSADQRLYDNAIRQQIDIRVKSLHMYCDGFKTPISGEDSRFKAFQSLMNGRNDFLHGNITPSAMLLEDIYFDEKYTPLFKKDEGIIQKVISKYLSNVSIEEVLKDERAVVDLIGLIMETLDEPSFESFSSIFHIRFPGINVKTKEIGIVISESFAEGFVSFDRPAEDDPNYQLFTDDVFSFEIYIPSLWSHQHQNERYTFRPTEPYNPENLIVSTMENTRGKQLIDELAESGTILMLNGKAFYRLPLPAQLRSRSYVHLSADHKKIAHFTYTFEEPTPELEWRSLEQMIRDTEKVIGSFVFIDPSDKEKRKGIAKYYSFLSGIATSHYLFSNAMENNSFFEAAVNIKNTIYSLLRISIVAFDQLKEKNDTIDSKWIYQNEKDPEISNTFVLSESLARGIITEEVAGKLAELDKKLFFFFDHFITSGVTQPKIRDLALELYYLSEPISDKLTSLEQQQVKEQVGSWKTIKDVNENFYRKFISAKLGSRAYL